MLISTRNLKFFKHNSALYAVDQKTGLVYSTNENMTLKAALPAHPVYQQVRAAAEEVVAS